MDKAVKTILTGVITAAIVGNVAFLFNVNARLASMETQIKYLVEIKTQNLANR